MIKKTITYENYNGEIVTEDFYFNLSSVELLEMEFFKDGSSFTDKVKILMNTKDVGNIIGVLKDIVLKSYGVKSPDGKRFIKNQDIRDSFEQCPAFEVLYLELSTNADFAAEFLNGLMPSSLKGKTQQTSKDELIAKFKAFEEKQKDSVNTVE